MKNQGFGSVFPKKRISLTCLFILMKALNLNQIVAQSGPVILTQKEQKYCFFKKTMGNQFSR